MYHPHYYDRPIRHLFWGGTNDIKSMAETELRRQRTHLWKLREHHDAMEPKLHIFPMLVYLLLHYEQQPGEDDHDAAGAGTLSVLLPGARNPLPPGVAVDPTVALDRVAEVLAWVLITLARCEGREGGVVGKRSTVERKCFLGTLGREEGEGLGVEKEEVVVGGVC
ncbi:hypothetical protein NDU88_001153 [Pleurodeles waltl]|uniref:Uncharacterized protein n=1 Tax=Pleurodeles waltl TaxID=8319 RepID=A0AAV7URZ5_PLEWA|nr:hypothetical protein NDU88_001153 [Pleurodeles waltl]